jgi:hypothetical protein
MTDEQVREMVEASLRIAKAADAISESALNLMSLIERTQADAARLIAAQLKRSERTMQELRSMRLEPPPGTKVRLSDGRVVEVPTLSGGGDVEGQAP